jgi:cyanophycinase
MVIQQHLAQQGRIGQMIGAVVLELRILGIGIEDHVAEGVQGSRFRVMGSGAA